MKVAAVLLGPAGVGLAGLYMNLVQTAATVAALGIGNVGTRQVAAAHADGGDITIDRVRRALSWGTTVLSIVGAILFWLMSGWIARVVLEDETRASDVAWLSLGVALTVAAGSQSALLTGLRRVGDLARISIITGVTSTLIGSIAIWMWGTNGLPVMVLIAPAATFCFGHLYVRRLISPMVLPISWTILAQEWRKMVQLGIAFMISGLVTLLAHLLARTIIKRELGSDALGQFQAAWSIGMTYLGIVLAAMGTDYFPRLTALINDHTAATRLVNEQTEVALLVCVPVMLVMLGFAPWIVEALYSRGFGEAVEMLQWQLLGDVFKLMSWPLGYIIIASGAGALFIFTEALAAAVFLFGTSVGLPHLGLKAVGVSFLMFCLAYLPLVWWLGGRRIDFRWTRAVWTEATASTTAMVTVAVTARYSDLVGAVLSVVLATLFGSFGLARLLIVTSSAEVPGRLRVVAKFWLKQLT